MKCPPKVVIFKIIVTFKVPFNENFSKCFIVVNCRLEILLSVKSLTRSVQKSRHFFRGLSFCYLSSSYLTCGFRMPQHFGDRQYKGPFDTKLLPQQSNRWYHDHLANGPWSKKGAYEKNYHISAICILAAYQPLQLDYKDEIFSILSWYIRLLYPEEYCEGHRKLFCRKWAPHCAKES